ncbi:MAG: hypothetical protein WD602_11220 [Actinomycetota bacterium]
MSSNKRAAAQPPSGNRLGTVLKVVAALHAALVLLQAVFAGNFMAGDDAAMRIHQVLGTQVLYPIAIGQAILGTVLWRRKELSLAYPLLAAAVVLAEGAQIGLGFTGRTALHVPLGVALFGATTALLLMSHKPLERPVKEGAEDPLVEPSG